MWRWNGGSIHLRAVVLTITANVNDESFLKQNQNNDELWNEAAPRNILDEVSLEEPNIIEGDIGQDTEAQNQNNDELWNEAAPRNILDEVSLEEPNIIEGDIGQDTEAVS
uniref:Uncharacterized protein n=1 Tax=Ascaris lumbricoides TaxID=6252 RepID=A0A0M3IX04_ASCLU